jgi:hypothetical protein
VNPAAPIEAMARLARHPVNYVRRGVARNPEAPAELIDALAADEDMQPRWWAALHPRIAPAALERLAADPEQNDAEPEPSTRDTSRASGSPDRRDPAPCAPA